MSEIDVSKCMFHQECVQYGEVAEKRHLCKCYKNPTAYCKDSYNCYFKEHQQVKQENEELKYKLSDTEHRLVELSKANTHNLVLLQRRNNCLDEIEEMCKDNFCIFADGVCDGLGGEILQLIKQAKEGE